MSDELDGRPGLLTRIRPIAAIALAAAGFIWLLARL